MEPTLHPGDLVLVAKVDPHEIMAGDIVAVRGLHGVYVHRVVEKIYSDEEILLRLKGDNNEYPDPGIVKGSDIVGKLLLCIPTGYLCTSTGYVTVIILPLSALIINQIIKTYRLCARRRRYRGWKRILLGDGRSRKVETLDLTSGLLFILIILSCTHRMTPLLTLTGLEATLRDREYTIVKVGAATWKVPSSISCNVRPSSPLSLGESITAYGCIKPARKDVDVILTYRAGDEVVKRTVKTGEDGCYIDIFTPNLSGTWTVQAEWSGDAYYYGSQSGEVEFIVVEGEGDG